MDGANYVVSSVRRCSRTLAILAFASLLVSCSGAGGHYDYGFRPADAVGRWESDDGATSVRFDIDQDGEFTAYGWPSALYCDGAIPDAGVDTDDLWVSTVDYSGTWKMGGEGAPYIVSFLSLGPECRSNWSAVAWTEAGQPSFLRVYLSPLDPVDELEESRVLDLHKQ